MNIRRTEAVLNILIGLGILALIAVLGYPRYQETKSAKVRIGVANDFGSLLFLIPTLDSNRAYYQMEKITPVFIPLTDQPLDDIKRGICDFAAVPWADLLAAPLAGIDTVKVLASVVVQQTHDALVISRSSKVKNLLWLKNKKVGFRRSDARLAGMILDALEQQGLIGIQRLPLSDSETMGYLKEGRVDALYLTEPWLSYALHQGDTTLLTGLTAMYVTANLPDLALVCRSDYLRHNRRAVVRMKKLIEAVIGHLRNKPEMTSWYMARRQGWSTEARSRMDMKTPLYQRLADIDLPAVEKYRSLLRERGAVVSPLTAKDLIFDRSIFN